MTRKTRGRGYRDHGRGSLVLDRTFRGVGRIKVASGTTDRHIFELLNGMLGTLHHQGRLDLLDAIKRRRLAPLECWMHFREHDLERIPNANVVVGLAKAAEDWITRKHASDGHKRNLRAAFAALTRGRPTAKVADLPDLLRTYRETCERAGTARVFNGAKAAARRFLKERMGPRAPLYLDVLGVPGLTEARAGGHPQTVTEAKAIREALGAAHGRIWWAMCCTGMGPGELWGSWSVEGQGLRIRGTKTTGRDRLVPRVDFVHRPERAYRPFRIALGKLDRGVTPYDGRRTFAHWMEEAGIPRTRRRQYLGHTIGDVTDRYESHDVVPYLAEDGARLRRYLQVHVGALDVRAAEA